MNKKFLTQILSFVALALIGWGCEVDHYNEHMIDGYEPDNTITDVQTVNRTLSEGDYSAISSNSANKALAFPCFLYASSIKIPSKYPTGLLSVPST